MEGDRSDARGYDRRETGGMTRIKSNSDLKQSIVEKSI